MNTLWTVAIALCSAILVSIGLNPVLIELSTRHGWYAKTNHRTIHTGKIPYIGGIAIFAAFIIGVIATELAVPVAFNTFPQLTMPFLLFGICYFSIHVLGLVDDFVNINARYKLIVQFAAAAAISIAGYSLKGIQITDDVAITFGPFSHVLTIIWLVGVSNAVNLIDGMDGLSGVTSAIAALFFGIAFLVLGSVQSAIVAFALLGGIIGFLLFNWPQAKIFMGDNGALFLGFTLASLPFFEHSGIVRLEYLFIPVSLLFFPIIDTFMAIGRRIKHRKPFHSPDKEHVHHRLLALGYSQGRILIMLMGIVLLPAISALVVLWIELPYGAISVAFGWVTSILFFRIATSKRKKIDIRSPAKQPTAKPLL